MIERVVDRQLTAKYLALRPNMTQEEAEAALELVEDGKYVEVCQPGQKKRKGGLIPG